MTLPMRNQKHYCRHCLVVMGGQAVSGGTVHRRMYRHVQEDHPTQALPPLQCSKYCSEREQPEEKRAGVKLYGPGRKITPPIKTFEELFPVEEDDHT